MRRISRALTVWAVAWGAVCAWPQVSGAQYSWQLSGAHEQHDFGAFVELDATNLEATYHFRPIDTQLLGGPYALAGFLNRSTRMTGGLRRERSRTYLNTGQQTSSTSFDGYSLSGRYVWREPGWFLGGHTEHRSADLPSSMFLEQTFKAERYGFSGGKYVAESTAVEATFESELARVRSRWAVPCLSFCPHDSRDRTDVISLSVMHVGQLRQMSYAMSASASDRSIRTKLRGIEPLSPDAAPPPYLGYGPLEPQFTNTLSSRVYSASGQLFPTARLGVGVGYSSWHGDTLEDYSYDLSTVWFFRPNIGARVGWSRAARDQLLERRADTISFRLLGRF